MKMIRLTALNMYVLAIFRVYNFIKSNIKFREYTSYCINILSSLIQSGKKSSYKNHTNAKLYISITNTIYCSRNQPIFLFVLSLEYLQSKIETLLAYHVCNHVFLHIEVYLLQNSTTVFP